MSWDEICQCFHVQPMHKDGKGACSGFPRRDDDVFCDCPAFFNIKLKNDTIDGNVSPPQVQRDKNRDQR